jgi:hypothetical protein
VNPYEIYFPTWPYEKWPIYFIKIIPSIAQYIDFHQNIRKILKIEEPEAMVPYLLFLDQSRISTFKSSVFKILHGLHHVSSCQMKAEMLMHMKWVRKSAPEMHFGSYEQMLAYRGVFSKNYTVTPPKILVNYISSRVFYGHIVS